MKDKNLTKTLILYFILFYIAWAGSEFLLSIISIENPILYTIIREGILKNLIWTLPAFLLIKTYHDSVEIPLKDMFTNKTNWIKYLPIFLLFTAFILLGTYRIYGAIKISPTFDITNVIIVIFVGITEELVFRGWLLNATIKGKKDDDIYLPMIINGILFLSIHFPKWISSGEFLSNIMSLGFIQIILLSVIFSYVFIKSRNILVPIALHMYWDLLVFMFQ
ncbi:MAG: lysostaphin resistance A-like protein [Oscillospiraceae bacterium]